MNKLLLSTALSLLITSPAFAAGTHGGGHDDDGHGDMHKEMMAGMPGKSANVDRTIDVTMRETDDGEMIFEPAEFDIKKGETIRFNVTNKGEIEHEFVVDTMEGNAEHKEAMAKMDMEHDDPNSVRLDSGMEGEVIWTFANEGSFEFACLIPGHYESGMHGPITVAQSDEAPAAPAVYSSGKIKKVDAKGNKVTIIHGPLENLDMPSMTMVFKADEALIAKMKEGQNIEFVADRVKGKLTVTEMK
ncbi:MULTISPECIES: copper-binding protein [Sulfitobacter]|uniref:copper-binding protein n=2 Tax=Alphaproteobacteria TaxID=28211 RepID=UPI001581A118|nr:MULTISPECIES: copper-binding protein [Sulfitobacter]NUH65142.1 copper-binding protein [Sulfitobacter maritimus]WCE68140.1 copper-binding protein [Sulfitobacter faviae]